MASVFLATILLAQDDPRAVLQKLADSLKSARTLAASFKQVRRSALLDEPIVSRGRLAWRREPEALAFLITEPSRSEVRFEKGMYTVYRPDEKQVERFELEDDSMTRALFAAFTPDVARIEAFAKVSLDDRKRVVLEPKDPKSRKLFSGIALGVGPDGGLRGITLREADGDEVEFELTDVVLNAEVPADTFALKTPPGVRVLTHKVAADR